MMKPLLQALMKEGLFSIVLLVILCLLVWFGGAYLDIEVKTRYAVIGALLGMWALMFISQKIRAVKGAMRIEKQLKAQSGAQLAGADADKKAEIQALRKKFDESLEALKKSKGGKSALFTLPWYVIIGPPGSGKTTALQESGLNFPASQGNAKVKGIGGTRNCDWWFTDEGILLDTAGRYTTVAEDQEEWLAFLSMIKAGRNQKPINGAIVAVGIDELLRGNQADLDRIAKDVRNRLDELSARLQAVFPVYVMFTKCDLLPGFVEFFEDFTKEERSQVWGMTFPFTVPDKQYADIFEDETRRMVEALAPRRLQLLSSERPAVKKQSIYLFTRQYELALPRMKEFVGSLFHANAFQESAILRGIYFSSGTQKGTPIDQLMQRMGAALGVATEAPDDDRIEKKSYFINHLFTQIMFPDKALARSTSSVLRKRRMGRAGLQFASVLALALASYALISAFVTNKDLIGQSEVASAQLPAVKPNPAKELEELRQLEAMRLRLSTLYDYELKGRPVSMTIGMYQGAKLFDAGVQPYMERLRPRFLDPAGRRAKEELQQRLAAVRDMRSSEDYQQLLDLWRVYRIIGGDLAPPADNKDEQGQMTALVASTLKKNKRWTGTLAGSAAGEIEELAGNQLEFYASLLPLAYEDRAKRPWLIVIDADLVKNVAVELKNAYWDSAAYDTIVQRAREKLEPLTLASMLAGDENRGLLEVQKSKTDDKNKTDDPQTFLCVFTQEAWDSQVRALIEERAKDLSEMFKQLQLNKSADELVKTLNSRHRERHAQEWKRFLSAVYPGARGFMTIKDARDSMRRLAGEKSPYRTLFRQVWAKRMVNIGPGERLGDITETETKAIEDSIKALDELRDALDTFDTATQVGERVRKHLADPKKLENLRDAINNSTRKIRAAFPQGAEAGADVLVRVVESVLSALRTEARRELEGDWSQLVAQPWSQDTAAKYPFIDKAADGVPLDQFAALFNPKNGALWQTDALCKAVQALKFNEAPLFVFRATYDDAIKDAAVVRDAMFDTPQDEKVRVRFGITLAQRGLLRSSSFQLGLDPGKPGTANILRWNDNRDQSKDFVWEQLDTTRFKPGAKITASWGESTPRTDQRDLLDDNWGLLRILRDGGMSAIANTEGKQFYCRWEFTAPDGVKYTLESFVNAAKSVNPFTPEVFTRLKIVEGVCQ